MRDLAFIGIFLAMLPISVQFTHVSVMLWIWSALATPLQYMFGIAQGIPFNKIAVGSAVLSLVIDRTKKKFYVDAHSVLFLLFLLQSLISFSFSLSDADRVYDVLDRLSKVWLLTVFMAAGRRDRLAIHGTVLVIAISLGIHGQLDGLKFLASGGGHKVVAPASFGDNNYLALASLMIMPLLMYLYRYSEAALVRTGFALALMGTVFGIVAGGSRGAMIGMAIVALVTIMRSRSKILGLAVVALIGIGVAATVQDQWVARMNTIETARQDESFNMRVMSWKMHTLAALDRPLVGSGFSALESWPAFNRYLPSFSELDFIPTETPLHPLAAHSIYFQTLGDLGFPGLVLFIALLVNGFRNAGAIKRLTKGDPSLRWAADLGVGLHLVLLVYMISGALLSASYFEIFYIELTLLSVLRRHVEEHKKEQAAAMPAARWDQSALTESRPYATTS